MAHDVFICHAFEDAQRARTICERLESGGIRCWIAPRDPLAGIPYGKQLVDAIEGARVVLLVFSAGANGSQAVLSELELASNRRKIVLPVRIEDVMPSANLEFYIRSIHWFDAVTQSLESAAPELVRHVQSLISQPEAQVAAAAPAHALAQRTVNAPRNNLPFTLTSFVGRDREIAEIEELLETSRLVTLAGAGGVGKTRCALHIGNDCIERMPDGVWFVDLAEILDGSLTPATVAAVFDLQESPNRPILETLIAYLKRKKLLIILDNCEHLVAEAATAAQAILQSCPDVSILATSREVLGLAGEQIYRMPTLGEAEAVALFADRAASADRRFVLGNDNKAAVASICRHLDGIALAIELAAARAKVLSVADIDRRLGERFRLLTGGNRTALPRHQTLHAAIDWSYDLLTEAERALFRKIAIFIGGFTLDLVTAVCSDETIHADDVIDLVSSLVDKSLLQADFISEQTRYELLESTREYARQKLIEHGELEATIRAHAIAYTELAEEMERAWETTPDSVWSERAEAEVPNWRPALRWALGLQRDVELGQRLAAALRPVWFTMAPSEGLRWIRAGLEAIDVASPQEVIARLHLAEAHLLMFGAQYKRAQTAAELSIAIFARLNDRRGEGLAQLFAGGALGLSGSLSEGEALLRSALEIFRNLDASRAIGAALLFLAITRLNAGDVSGSRPLFAEALTAYKQIGAERPAAHIALNLAEAEFQSGDPEAALRLASEALASRQNGNSASVAFDLCNLAAYLVALRRWSEAATHAREALTLAREMQIEAAIAWAIQHLAAIAALKPSEDAAPAGKLRFLGARLIGFVGGRLEELNIVRDFTEQQEYDLVMCALREDLGEQQLANLIVEGHNWDELRATREAAMI